MSDLVRTLVIILAVIGAIGVVAAIWEELGPRIRRDKTEELDFDDDFEANDVRSAAMQLELENTWWEMSPEALEAEPAFELAVSALVDPGTDVDEVVTLSRDADGWVASMALAALAQREDVPDDWLTWAARNPVRPSVCEDRLLLRALAVHSRKPVIGAGLHVLEHVDEDRDGSPVVDRDQVQVVVVARAPHAEARSDDVERAARSALAKVEAPTVIVRRYRPGKAPLVRDGVRGYRTGRLERVLAGDFDLY